MKRELLLTNGRIYDLEREGRRSAALRVDATGRVAELYPEGAPLPPASASLEVVDLGGATVVPAFIDAHAHFMEKAAVEALAVNLAVMEGDRLGPPDLEGVRAALLAGSEGRPGPIVGFGLCLGAVAERRLPTVRELDAWFPGRPAIVLSMDGHSSAFSTQALERIGVAGLAENGILSGEAHEFNMGKISAFMMKRLGPASLARGLSATIGEAIAGGLVSIHCLEGTEDTPTDPVVAAFNLIGGRLGLRLRLWMQYTSLERARRRGRALERRRVGGCMAWEMDGSVSSRTAAFDEPYRDRPDSGRLYRTPEEAFALVEPFYRAGWQTSAHAIGPRGIESALSAYERAMDGSGDTGNALRLRIDHFEFPRPDQVERAGRRGLVLAVQPGFAWADERYIHSYEEALSPAARASQCPLRSLVESGCVVALSTDAPVQPLNPLIQIAGAVEHPIRSERLSVYQALRAYSWAGAYAAFEENERGTLAPGKYADLAVLDADPFAVPTERLQSIGVIETRHEGRRLAPPQPGLAAFAAHAIATKRRPL